MKNEILIKEENVFLVQDVLLARWLESLDRVRQHLWLTIGLLDWMENACEIGTEKTKENLREKISFIVMLA